MPIFPEHRDDIKGALCDLKNSGKTRYGGASTAAAFLEVCLSDFNCDELLDVHF
jgi:leucyl aminopeptidase